MSFKKLIKFKSLLGLFLLGIFLIPQNAEAHCDSMDGPVVKAAQKALETGDINGVLIWIYPEQEEEVKAAFRKTLQIRDTNEEVREVADMYFFETVVRLHRESEGAPYTGLKPAGTDFGPAIPAADKALETGSLEAVHKLIVSELEKGLHKYLEEIEELKNFESDDIEAGRKYVEAYVKYMHYIEPIYKMVKLGSSNTPVNHSH